jgi:hypothetical protein
MNTTIEPKIAWLLERIKETKECFDDEDERYLCLADIQSILKRFVLNSVEGEKKKIVENIIELDIPAKDMKLTDLESVEMELRYVADDAKAESFNGQIKKMAMR